MASITDVKIYLNKHVRTIVDQKHIIAMRLSSNHHDTYAPSALVERSAPSSSSLRRAPTTSARSKLNDTSNGPRSTASFQICRNWQTHGSCPFGPDCRYKGLDGLPHGDETSVPEGTKCGQCGMKGDHWWTKCPNRRNNSRNNDRNSPRRS
jgi:hypothetical protein